MTKSQTKKGQITKKRGISHQIGGQKSLKKMTNLDFAFF
jgi:hypothetical protein